MMVNIKLNSKCLNSRMDSKKRKNYVVLLVNIRCYLKKKNTRTGWLELNLGRILNTYSINVYELAFLQLTNIDYNEHRVWNNTKEEGIWCRAGISLILSKMFLDTAHRLVRFIVFIRPIFVNILTYFNSQNDTYYSGFIVDILRRRIII